MFSANRRDFKCSKINLSPHGQSNTLWQATCTGRLGLGRCWQCLRYRFYVFLCQQIPAQYPEGPMSFYIPSLSSLSNSTRPSCILFCYHPLVSAISAADSLLQPFSSTPFIPGSVTATFIRRSVPTQCLFKAIIVCTKMGNRQHTHSILGCQSTRFCIVQFVAGLFHSDLLCVSHAQTGILKQFHVPFKSLQIKLLGSADKLG